jgi:hypothetical protein
MRARSLSLSHFFFVKEFVILKNDS